MQARERRLGWQNRQTELDNKRQGKTLARSRRLALAVFVHILVFSAFLFHAPITRLFSPSLGSTVSLGMSGVKPETLEPMTSAKGGLSCVLRVSFGLHRPCFWSGVSAFLSSCFCFMGSFCALRFFFFLVFFFGLLLLKLFSSFVLGGCTANRCYLESSKRRTSLFDSIGFMITNKKN